MRSSGASDPIKVIGQTTLFIETRRTPTSSIHLRCLVCTVLQLLWTVSGNVIWLDLGPSVTSGYAKEEAWRIVLIQVTLGEIGAGIEHVVRKRR